LSPSSVGGQDCTAMPSACVPAAANLEGDGGSKARHPPPRLATGWPQIDARLGGGLTLAGIHEWFPATREGEGLASRGRREACWFPPIGVAIHLLWRLFARDAPSERTLPTGRRLGRILWIGEEIHPHPRSLVGGLRRGLRMPWFDAASDQACTGEGDRGDGAEGIAASVPVPDLRLLEASWFATVPAKRAASGRRRVPAAELEPLAWMIEQAIRNRGIAAVVADGSGLAMAATRRLHLAAQSAAAAGTPTLCLLLRPPWERQVISAAATRWEVEACLEIGQAATAGTAREGLPCWRVTLAKCRGKGGSGSGDATASSVREATRQGMRPGRDGPAACGDGEPMAAAPPQWSPVLAALQPSGPLHATVSMDQWEHGDGAEVERSTAAAAGGRRGGIGNGGDSACPRSLGNARRGHAGRSDVHGDRAAPLVGGTGAAASVGSDGATPHRGNASDGGVNAGVSRGADADAPLRIPHRDGRRPARRPCLGDGQVLFDGEILPGRDAARGGREDRRLAGKAKPERIEGPIGRGVSKVASRAGGAGGAGSRGSSGGDVGLFGGGA
jgi:hypothetical protein